MAAVSTLDFKLGARMLRRYPGLSLIGGLALSLAIGAGVLAFQLVRDQLTPSLPLAQGDRIVRIENFDRMAGAPEPHALYDLQRWRDGLKSVVQLGAARSMDRNLILPDQPPRPVPVAEMTPSGFALTRVRRCKGARCSRRMHGRARPTWSSSDTSCGSTGSAAIRPSSARSCSSAQRERRSLASCRKGSASHASSRRGCRCARSRARRATVRRCSSSAAWLPVRRSRARGSSLRPSARA